MEITDAVRRRLHDADLEVLTRAEVIRDLVAEGIVAPTRSGRRAVRAAVAQILFETRGLLLRRPAAVKLSLSVRRRGSVKARLRLRERHFAPM